METLVFENNHCTYLCSPLKKLQLIKTNNCLNTLYDLIIKIYLQLSKQIFSSRLTFSSCEL